MTERLLQRLRSLGPGLILAAAGIGAGDAVVASVTGIKFGPTLLWAIALTAGLKFVLTEALARWQLATGETITRAWVTRFPRWVSVLFAAYLVFWSFLVGASLSSACGIAGASLFPALSVPWWGAIHAVFATFLVALNRYARFQKLIKLLVAVMAGCVLLCAFVAAPPPRDVLTGLLWPRVPSAGGGAAILALLGGIGGSVTVICYAYWLRAEGWSGPEKLSVVRRDVRLAYVFTGTFGVALCLIAAGVHAHDANGPRIALEIAGRLRDLAGPAARGIFLLGFWATVFAAMLGVWQGVPSIYVDLVGAWRQQPTTAQDRPIYLGALVWLAGPPLVLLWFQQPVAIVVAFSIAGAFFMPFLAATLLYLNNRRAWLGPLANRTLGNLALSLCLLTFGLVCAHEIISAAGR